MSPAPPSVPVPPPLPVSRVRASVDHFLPPDTASRPTSVDTLVDLSRRARLIPRGGGGPPATGVIPNGPPSSTDTRSHGIKIPTIAGSEGGFWGLISGLAVAVIASSVVLWLCIRRRKRLRQNPAPPPAAQSNNSFTSLLSFFRPSARSASASADPTASKRGWLHGSNQDWNHLADDDDMAGTPGADGRGGRGQSIELYEAVSRSNPDPSGKELRRTESHLAGPGQLYGSGGGESSPNHLSMHSFKSTSSVQLSSPFDDPAEATPSPRALYFDHNSPVIEGDRGYFPEERERDRVGGDSDQPERPSRFVEGRE